MDFASLDALAGAGIALAGLLSGMYLDIARAKREDERAEAALLRDALYKLQEAMCELPALYKPDVHNLDRISKRYRIKAEAVRVGDRELGTNVEAYLDEIDKYLDEVVALAYAGEEPETTGFPDHIHGYETRINQRIYDLMHENDYPRLMGRYDKELGA